MSENLHSIPNNWIWTKIESLGDVVTGKTPKKSVDEYYGKDVPFFKPKDLNNGFYVKESEDNLSELGANNVRILPPKSILVTCIGATIGKTGFSRVTGATNQQINSIIPSEFISPEYVFYLLSSPYVQKEIKEKASATTLPILNKTKFQKLDIPLPPLNEQKRIVIKIEELFTRLDAGVEELHKTKQQLKVYRQSLLKHAFEGKLTQEWRETHKDELEPASILLERIKEERKEQLGKKYKVSQFDITGLPKLPHLWVWAQIGEITGPSKERWQPNVDDKQIFIGLKNIKSNNGKILEKEDSSGVKSTKTKFYEGDVLYGRLRPYLNKVCVPDFNGICSTDIIVFPKIKFINSKYLSYFLSTNDFVSFATKNMSGVQHPRINFKIISKYPIPLPPINEQNFIINQLEYKFSLVLYNQCLVDETLLKSEQLRQSILKKAFMGQLVPQNPEDAPAAVLLKRIKAEKESHKPKRKRKSRKKKNSSQEVLV